MSSSGSGWRLSQMPLLAMSCALASSISRPCSMHFTPAAMAWRTASDVYACTVT